MKKLELTAYQRIVHITDYHFLTCYSGKAIILTKVLSVHLVREIHLKLTCLHINRQMGYNIIAYIPV